MNGWYMQTMDEFQNAHANERRHKKVTNWSYLYKILQSMLTERSVPAWWQEIGNVKGARKEKRQGLQGAYRNVVGWRIYLFSWLW